MAATILLISRADFTDRVELSVNMVDAKIKPRILEAEDFDLRELMGDAFYYDFVGNSTSTPYALLLNGGSYIIDGITYTFEGIKPVLVYYAASRIMKNLDIHFTPNGMMQKRNEYSDHMEIREIEKRSNQYINQGLAYWNMCIKFLDHHRTEYPLWKQGCGCDTGRTGKAPKMSGVRASDDFYITGGYGYGYGR